MSLEVVITVGKIIYKYGGKQLDTLNHLEEINEIYRNIANVYSGISNAHFKSAQLSLNSSTVSSRPEMEIYASIHHLIDAFHVIKQLHTATRREKKMFIFTLEKKIVENPLVVHENCINICLLIHDLYCILKEKKIAMQWEKTTLDSMNGWVNCFKEEYSVTHFWEDNNEKVSINSRVYKKLKAISRDYVECDDSSSQYHPEGIVEYNTKYYVTNKGKKHCFNLINRIISKTNSTLSKSKEMLL